MLRTVAATYRDAFSGLPRPVWLISAATLVNRSGTMVLPFLALFLTSERGFSVTHAGQILAMYGIGGVAGSYLGGWLSDLFPPRRVMEGSLVLTGVGFLVLEHAGPRWAILLTMLALSLVAEAFRPACSAAIATAAAPEERVRAFALNRLAINMGMSLGPAVGGFLAARNYSWLFRVDGTTCVLAALFLWASFRKEPAVVPPAASEAGGPGDGSPWRDVPFLAAMALVFLLATVTFQMTSTYPLTLRDLYGFDEARIGLVLSINTVLIVLFEMVLVHRLQARNPLRIVALGSFLFCLGFGLLPFGVAWGFLYVALTVALWTVGEMLTLPLLGGVVANRAGERSRGRYMALFTIAFEGAFVVAPLLGTWVYQTLGLRVLWLGCIAMGVLLLGGFWGLAGALGPGPSPASGRGA
jgi:predicted MFS family arabinose efflux permease